MTVSIDTNVLVAFLDEQVHSETAYVALQRASASSKLLVCAPVFAELLALPGRHEQQLELFFAETGILLDWNLTEAMWRRAGTAHQRYSIRKQRFKQPKPRRILADFLIGAHADVNGYALLTMDRRHYRAAFPSLKVLSV